MTARVRNITLASGMSALAVLLGIATAWTQLGWPRPALSSDLEPLQADMATMQQFQIGTRAIVLDQQWWRLQEQIDGVAIRLEETPGSPMLRDHHRRLIRSQGAIQKQIDQLK
ncbi:MAG: hypothetical protein ACR2QF_11000 [Geminicoccaceae bacterium]